MPDDPLWCLVIPSNSVLHPSVPLDVLRAPTGTALAGFVNDMVGGSFEVVRGPAGAWMYLNEEGKFLHMRENLVATALAHEVGLSLADWIAGQVVVFGQADDDGWDTSVPEEFLALVEKRGCHIVRRQST